MKLMEVLEKENSKAMCNRIAAIIGSNPIGLTWSVDLFLNGNTGQAAARRGGKQVLFILDGPSSIVAVFGQPWPWKLISRAEKLETASFATTTHDAPRRTHLQELWQPIRGTLLQPMWGENHPSPGPLLPNLPDRHFYRVNFY